MTPTLPVGVTLAAQPLDPDSRPTALESGLWFAPFMFSLLFVVASTIGGPQRALAFMLASSIGLVQPRVGFSLRSDHAFKNIPAQRAAEPRLGVLVRTCISRRSYQLRSGPRLVVAILANLNARESKLGNDQNRPESPDSWGGTLMSPPTAVPVSTGVRMVCGGDLHRRKPSLKREQGHL